MSVENIAKSMIGATWLAILSLAQPCWLNAQTDFLDLGRYAEPRPKKNTQQPVPATERSVRASRVPESRVPESSIDGPRVNGPRVIGPRVSFLPTGLADGNSATSTRDGQGKKTKHADDWAWLQTSNQWSHTANADAFDAMNYVDIKALQNQRLAGCGWPGQPCSCDGCQLPHRWCRLPGFNGHPYDDRQACGVRCNYPCLRLPFPNFSPHWPRPWHDKSCYIAPGCPVPSQPRDELDWLADIKLSNFKRKDSGYAGCYCDPYGMTGEQARGIHVAATVTSVSPRKDYFKRGQTQPTAAGGGAIAAPGPSSLAPAAPQGIPTNPQLQRPGVPGHPGQSPPESLPTPGNEAPLPQPGSGQAR